jgi:hypothetical protein
VGVGGLIVIRLNVDFGKLVKVALKGGWVGKGMGRWEMRMGAAGFCGVFLF